MVYQKRDWTTDSIVGASRIFFTVSSTDLRNYSLNAGNMLAQGLGGLLAAGILSGMEGARGIRGWRWVRIAWFNTQDMPLTTLPCSYSLSKELLLSHSDFSSRSSWQTTPLGWSYFPT